nr:GNAT family N-acetyltransferase [Flexivirga meconopsidis]
MGADSSGEHWRSRARAWFGDRVGSNDYGIFVVDIGSAVVACAVAAIRDAAPSPSVPDGRDVLISNVCTFPQYRGQGHGQRAFHAALAWARTTGVGRAELMATEGGRRIYESAGFTQTHFPAMRAEL